VTAARRGLSGARVHKGLIASGDRFVSGAGESRSLHAALTGAGHEVLAVEMEGAAVAQVCHDYGVPFAAVRTISDRADDSAHVDFPRFVEEVASRYAHAIVERLAGVAGGVSAGSGHPAPWHFLYFFPLPQ
jgi:adenosylhomocysteine nucleosidase